MEENIGLTVEQELQLNTSSEAHEAVMAAASDAFNNQATAIGYLSLSGQRELGNQIRGVFSLPLGHIEPGGRSIQEQVTLTAQEVLDEISKKAGEREIEELISQFTEQIKEAQIGEDEERVLRAMKKIGIVWENLKTLAGKNPGKERPPLQRSPISQRIQYNLYFSPTENT